MSLRADERTWHACATPQPPDNAMLVWHCPVCLQTWIWRRPPRPVAQWVRREEEER